MAKMMFPAINGAILKFMFSDFEEGDSGFVGKRYSIGMIKLLILLILLIL